MHPTPQGRRPRTGSVELRATIRDAIYAAEDSGQPCPTRAELAQSLELSKDALRYHLDALVKAGTLEVRETRRREYCRPRVGGRAPEVVKA